MIADILESIPSIVDLRWMFVLVSVSVDNTDNHCSSRGGYAATQQIVCCLVPEEESSAMEVDDDPSWFPVWTHSRSVDTKRYGVLLARGCGDCGDLDLLIQVLFGYNIRGNLTPSLV